MVNKLKNTIPETNIAPENRPSQEETSIATIHFQGQAVSFREGSHVWISSVFLCLVVVEREFYLTFFVLDNFQHWNARCLIEKTLNVNFDLEKKWKFANLIIFSLMVISKNTLDNPFKYLYAAIV